MRTAIIIGSGFSGLSSACFLAKAGWKVTVLEKHDSPGGRARQFKSDGFSFDMGPSWYWMPDVFERFFASFGKKTTDYYELIRLDPSYRVYWQDGPVDIPANYTELQNLFESLETGSAKKLDQFLEEAEYKYDTGMKKLVFKPGLSYTEFMDWDLAKGIFKLDVFSSIKKHIEKSFKHPRIRQILEFPILFLGALPENTPALYSLMNYADIKLGTWYPIGGMYKVVEAMHSLAVELGVDFHFSENVTRIESEGDMAKSVVTHDRESNRLVYEAEVIIGSADYHFIETQLLLKEQRSYSDTYWNKRVMAPSCLLYYVGLNKPLKNIVHHSLFFDVNFEEHGRQIYTDPQWPTSPLFYVCASSVSDTTVAPVGGENLFFLIPVATGLEKEPAEARENYFNMIVSRFEQLTGESIKESIVFKKSFAPVDFVTEYNAFKGNAYGLANTLMQTATLKPSCRSKKLKNLFYTGQLTVPGPGVPPAIISGEVVVNEVNRLYKEAVEY